MSAAFDNLDEDLDDDILTPIRGRLAATESRAQEAGFLPPARGEAPGPSPVAANPDALDPSGPDIPIEAYEEEISRLRSVPFNSFARNTEVQPWGAPADFWKESTVPEMKHEWMPPALADLFCEEAETWAADPGIYGMFGNGICAGALSNAIKVQVKEGDPHALKAARLWLVVNAYSGSAKTPILLAMARPLEDLQEDLLAKVAYLQKKYIEDFDIYEKQRQAYISARAKNEPATRPEEPEKPPRGRLIIKNATGEAITDVLADQGLRGILGIYDEFTSLPTGANQYKRGGNDIEELLKLREGGRNSVDRKGTFTQIAEFGMNIVGGTQPDRIRKVIKNMDLTANGFLQRFNFYTAREAGLDLDRPAHEDFERLTDIVQRIYEMQAPAPVRFSDAAQQVRKEFRIWCFEQRQQPWLSDSFKSHLNKYVGFWEEFCLTYHAIDSADQRRMEILPEISGETAERVRALMTECLYPHARAFYQDIIDNESDTIKYVRYLAGKILAKGWTTLDLTRIGQGWTKWRNLKPWEKKAVLTMLSEGGWIQPLDPRGYIEGMSFRATVHPDLQEIFSGYVEMEQARLEELAEFRREKMAAQGG